MPELGIGLYSLSEAARLVNANSRDVRRWMFGYDFTSTRADGTRTRHHSDPLWKAEYDRDPELGGQVIGFRDLLELRIVREFVHHGVPLAVVRKCLSTAGQLFGSSYPFTAQRFLTDGRTVFVEAWSEESESELLDLRHMQYVFKDVIRPSLYAGIEYEGSRARRWFPDARRRSVVLDPNIQFGKPTLAASSVPTETLYLSFKAEGGDERAVGTVSKIYELPSRQVRDAIRFESLSVAA